MTPADVQALALLLQNQNAAERKPTVDVLASYARLLARRVAAEHARLDYVERAAAEDGADDAVKLLATHLSLDHGEPFIERLRNVAGRTRSAQFHDAPADDGAGAARADPSPDSEPPAPLTNHPPSARPAGPEYPGQANQPGRPGRPARTPRQ